MRLRNPEFLWLLLLWLPMAWLHLRRERKTRPAIRFSDLSAMRALPRSPLARLRHAVPALRMAALGLLVVGLARPQKGTTEEEVSTEGVDIMLALDVSTSMKALDFKPKNRLHVAKETIKEFIGGRVSDRMGLVAYAGRTLTKCPLTLDYSVLTRFVEDLDFGEVEDGTAIGTAIATAANRIRLSPAKSKVIILATDGANNRGEIAPLTAAQAAGELGIRIHTIGVGRRGQVPYPFEYFDRYTGKSVGTRVQMIESDLDEETLQAIAQATGGQYFRAENAEQLKEIYAIIDKMEKTEIQTKSYTTYSERFFPWLAAGAVLLLVELVLSHTVFRRIP